MRDDLQWSVAEAPVTAAGSGLVHARRLGKRRGRQTGTETDGGQSTRAVVVDNSYGPSLVVTVLGAPDISRRPFHVHRLMDRRFCLWNKLNIKFNSES